MFHIEKQTHEQRVAMYMRCRKAELAEMLANRAALDDAQRWVPAIEPPWSGSPTWTPPYPFVSTVAYYLTT